MNMKRQMSHIPLIILSGLITNRLFYFLFYVWLIIYGSASNSSSELTTLLSFSDWSLLISDAFSDNFPADSLDYYLLNIKFFLDPYLVGDGVFYLSEESLRRGFLKGDSPLKVKRRRSLLEAYLLRRAPPYLSLSIKLSFSLKMRVFRMFLCLVCLFESSLRTFGTSYMPDFLSIAFWVWSCTIVYS